MTPNESLRELTISTTDFGEEVIDQVSAEEFRHQHSTQLFEEAFGNQLNNSDTLYVFIGSDSGLLQNWLLEKKLGTESRALILDFDQVIETITTMGMVLPYSKSVELRSFSDWQNSLANPIYDRFFFSGSIQTIRSLSVSGSAARLYAAELNKAEFDIASLKQKTQSELIWAPFIDRQLENVADNLWPASYLQDLLPMRTAVVLGAGPSLDDLLPWISENRSRIVLIAVSRVARQLKKTGLAPDFFVAIDPQDLCFDTSKEMLTFGEPTILVYAYHSAPVLHRQWNGPSFFTGDRFPWNTPLNPENLKTQGPTVTNQAVTLAMHLGCKSIILAGVDLCFSRDGYSHASGSFEHQSGPNLAGCGRSVLTNGGWYADTEIQLELAIAAMANLAELAKDNGCNLINPSLSAAQIPGVQHCLTDDIELHEQPYSVWDAFSARFPEPYDSDTDQLTTLSDLQVELLETKDQLRRMANWVDGAQRIHHQNKQQTKRKRDAAYRARLDVIEDLLNSDCRALSQLVKSYGIQSFLALPNTRDNEDWTEEQSSAWAWAYYQAYASSLSAISDRLEYALLKIENRLEELKVPPRVEKLTEIWTAESTPGRVIPWMARRPGLRLNDEEQPLIDGLIGDFQNRIDASESAFAQIHIRDRRNDGVRVLRKIRRIYREKDADALLQMKRQLSGVDIFDPTNLIELCEGLVAALNNDEKASEQHFVTIIFRASEEDTTDEKRLGLLDALQQMLVLLIRRQDLDAAIEVARSLTALSESYVPQLADLLRINGAYEEAVTALTEHLKVYPEDNEAMVRLAKVLLDFGDQTTAAWAIEQVLTREPTHFEATKLLTRLTSREDFLTQPST